MNKNISDIKWVAKEGKNPCEIQPTNSQKTCLQNKSTQYKSAQQNNNRLFINKKLIQQNEK